MHGRPGARPAAPPPDAVHYTLRRIRRPALAGRIAGALSHGVHVLLTAEAGFGKSAVLEEALALLAKRAWRVRPSEAAAQLQHLVAAAPDEDVVVVVDDAEQVANDEVVALLQRVLDAPAGPVLAIAGRSALPLRLRRARAAEAITELGPVDLAFDARETGEVLRKRLGREPSVRHLERVMEETEGWPLGVGLASSIGPVGPVRLDHRDALAFLREEVLDRLEPATRDALLDAAVPDELDAGLAEALGLGAEALAGLAAAGVFLRPARPDGAAYRFHPLFRALLRERGAAERPRARQARLHAAVAGALAAAGRTNGAVEHWLEAGDWRAALDAAVAAGPALARTAPDVLTRWRDRLPAEARETPCALLLEGALASAQGCPERALEPLAASVEAWRAAAGHAGEWTARALLASALLALGQGDAASDLAEGFDGPGGWRAGVAAPATALTAALALAGEGRAAHSRSLAAAALHHPAGGALTGLEHLRQAQLDVPRGELDRALARVHAAAGALGEDDPLAQRPALLAGVAWILGEQGRDDEALAAWQDAAAAAGAAGDPLCAAAARAERALLLARAGRLAEAELELARGDHPVAGWRRGALDAATAGVAALRGNPAGALAAADRAAIGAGRAPLVHCLSLAATLAPVMAEAGAPARAGELVAVALATADARMPGEAGAWARARLIVQRGHLSNLRGAEDEAVDDVVAAWAAAGPNAVHLVRREWPRLRPLVWAALERGRLAPEPVLRAIQRAWPGGEALLPFTDHPLAAVRSRAVGPVVASGHPRALGQLRDMAREADPAVAAAARAALESVRRAPPPLIFRLLGGFEARRGAWRIDAAAWGRPLTARLVRFLLVNRGTVVPEDVLFEHFWPGKPAASARRNLQVAVSMARGVLDTGLGGESIIEAVEHGYRLRLADHDLVDSEEFEVAAGTALTERDLAARRTLLERAAALWGGEPLPEDRYADWSRDWRRRLVDRYTGVLEALVDACRDEGDARATIQFATRLLELDPLNETVHRELMIAYARCGRIADALRQYLACRRLLVDELGVEPSAATSLMQGRILAGDFGY
ncbi:MAG: hypothetical protein E6G10_10180 [Actinobacteria bacterium]|nr:MAG: hypothetical protein E6G10_10180 [Actinomycetota bacterium]